jgi:hypothetical protein
MFESINSGGTQLLGAAWPTVWALVRILVVAVAILLCVAYLILWERKLIGWMHVRLGPNRVGPAGLLQPIADVLKLLLKEVIQPAQASRWTLPDRADHGGGAGLRGLGGDSVPGGRGARRHQRGSAVCDGDFVDRRVRRDSRRLGVELEVRVPRRDARRGADGLV